VNPFRDPDRWEDADMQRDEWLRIGVGVIVLFFIVLILIAVFA
jgi:hypothetical protein